VAESPHSPERRLAELGIELPERAYPPVPLLLRPVVVSGTVAYLSGNGDLETRGRVPDEVSLNDARAAARRTAHLHCRALRDELGSLDRVERWLKVLVLVRSGPGFGEQPQVANAYSEAIAELWGEERGLCARSAIGVAELPLNMAVEVEAVVALAP
jgi:enamine deaminase RidA (YjgF/YER057c/UK114 family)